MSSQGEVDEHASRGRKPQILASVDRSCWFCMIGFEAISLALEEDVKRKHVI